MEGQDDHRLVTGVREGEPEYKVLDKITPVFWYTGLINRFPKASCCCCVLIPLFLLFVLVCLVGLGSFSLSPDALLEDRNNRAFISHQSFVLAQREAVNELDNIVRDQSRLYFPLMLIFEAQHSSQVLKQRNIEEMKKIQDHIIEHKHFHKYCYRGTENTCEDPISVLNYFYPQIIDGERVYNGKGELVTDLNSVLVLMAKGEGIFQYSNFFVEKGFDKDLKSSITRIVINFAMPFDRKSISDDEDFIYMKDEIYEFQRDLNDYLKDASTEDMRVLYLANGTAFSEVQVLLYTDLGLSIISVILVFFFMCFQTGSLWLSIFGIFQIILAFPCSILTYYYLFNIPYFGAIHLLGVFVVLGIGADDTFIFIDTYKQSRQISTSKHERLYWSYKRAGKAMLVTSATTISAFIITSLATPFVALQTFGIFAALLVFWDYVLVMLLYPSILCLWSHWFEFRSIFCCVNNSIFSCIPAQRNKDWGSWREKNDFIRCFTCQSVDHAQFLGKEKDEIDHEGFGKEARFIDGFLSNFYALFVLHKWRRFLVLAYFTFFIIVVIIGAAFTAPSEESVQFVPDGTNLADALSLQDDFDQSPSELLQVTIVWGIEDLDQSSGDKYDEFVVGEVDYDRNFNPTTAVAQEMVLNVCNTARTYDRDMKIVDDDSDDSFVYCYQRAFNEWMGQRYPMSNLPVTGYEFEQRLREFVNSDDYFATYNDMIGFVDNRLSFVSVRFNTTQNEDETYKDGFIHRDAWWDYVDTLNDEAPGSMNSARAICSIWRWWNVQNLLFNQALIGMAISLFVAFICVTLFTLNIIVSFFATLAIASVVATVLCLFVVFQWQLGALEAISSIMVVGLSVDYSVHLAHAYAECPKKTRFARIRFAVDAVGISIISGGITTFLACAVLVFATVVFLQRFGILILCIVFFSLFFSFGQFITMLSVFGPQNGKGDLSIFTRPIFRRIYSAVDTLLYRIKNIFI